VKPLIIAGPTASGKSVLALSLAKALNGEIINADSGQLYQELPILSAMPEGDLQGVPHHLYGVLTYNEHSSAGWWRERVIPLIDTIQKRHHYPIIVGGTGLYFKALLKGIRDIPPIPNEVRFIIRKRFASLGKERFWQDLLLLDPLAEHYIKSTDSQRMQRAYEVKLATQHSLFSWPHMAEGISAFVIKIAPPRAELYTACDKRFETFLERGAIDEVQALLRSKFSSEILSTLQTIGFHELHQYIMGKCSLEEAISASKAHTRHYAKRQDTWFKHQIEANCLIPYTIASETLNRAQHYIVQTLLTLQL
jgi:tRNA dimethylallyltransferase